MKKFLKNYTSDVPVSQTIFKIEQVLIKCGVLGITKEYGPKSEVTAIRFHIPINDREVSIRLPANPDKALDALWLNYADGDKLTSDGKRLAYSSFKKKTRADFLAQAHRTAWKIIQDWIEVQMSMIQMKQAEQAEVFMPYIWDGKETIYDRIKNSGFRALLPEKAQT